MESVCDLELMDYTDVVVDGRFILAQMGRYPGMEGQPESESH